MASDVLVARGAGNLCQIHVSSRVRGMEKDRRTGKDTVRWHTSRCRAEERGIDNGRREMRDSCTKAMGGGLHFHGKLLVHSDSPRRRYCPFQRAKSALHCQKCDCNLLHFQMRDFIFPALQSITFQTGDCIALRCIYSQPGND
jgi:hypothetical protein